MSPTLIALGAVKVLTSNRKLQLGIIGLQLAYVTYKMVKENEAKSIKKQKRKMKKNHELREQPAAFK